MKREEILYNAYLIETKRLVKETHNDMDLGKKIRLLTNELNEKIIRLRG